MTLMRKGRTPRPPKARDRLTQAVLEAIEKTGLDDEWVTRTAGIGRNEMSRMRNGAVSPNASTLDKVLEACGLTMTIDDFITLPAFPLKGRTNAAEIHRDETAPGA